MKKKLIIEKQDTSKYSTEPDYTETDLEYTESYYHDNLDTEQKGGMQAFKSITKSEYAKPVRGSKQDNLSRDEVKEKLKGYIPLRTMEDKKMLTKMTPFKTWVRYINNSTKQFRTGGLLMKVEYPKYIMLANTNNNLTWSVQLKDNLIYVKDPKESELKQREREKEQEIKDKLYDLYKRGQLQTKK